MRLKLFKDSAAESAVTRHTDTVSNSDPHSQPHSQPRPNSEKATEAHDSEKGAEATALTGDDVVIGANAPVGDLGRLSGDAVEDHAQSREVADEKGRESATSENAPEVITDGSGAEELDEDEEGVDDESKYHKALPLAILTFGLCMSTFVVALDNTIIGIIPL